MKKVLILLFSLGLTIDLISQVTPAKVEECFDVGEPSPLGHGLAALGDLIEEGEDFVRLEFIQPF